MCRESSPSQGKQNVFQSEIGRHVHFLLRSVHRQYFISQWDCQVYDQAYTTRDLPFDSCLVLI